MEYIGWYALALAGAIIAVYVLVRVASFAHYRSRLEYFRNMVSELKRRLK